MNRRKFIQAACSAGAVALSDPHNLAGQNTAAPALEKAFQNPPADAGLSVVYHWTGGVVSKEGITADMEGIAASGISVVNWFYFDGNGVSDGVQAYPCKSPEWWDLVSHLMKEAKRCNLQIAPHVCSSWGPAGTEGITPELSQQALAWSEVEIDGGSPFTGTLAKPQRRATGRGSFGGGRGGASFPPIWASYYRDLAVLAFPIPEGWGETSVTRKARVTTNLPIKDIAKAADPANSERVVDTDQPGWIQFAFDQPFTLRAVTMNPGGGGGGMFGGGGTPNPYRVAHSLEVQAGDDGGAFRKIGQLEPMFNGWQSQASVLTHTVAQTTARYFRLVYTPGPPVGYDEGMRTGTRTTPGDFTKMIEPLGFASIVLSSTPSVHHLPAKSMATWGCGRLVTDSEIPASACVPLSSIVDLTSKLKEDGTIDNWTPGPGRWRIQRIGYMSQMGSTGGGLQCDKFSADAARVVFNGWFRQIRERIPDAEKIVKILNIDSWECGAQNWSPVLPEEFRARRGYELTKYLPCMTGVMVESAGTTEGFLLDLRRTASECIADNHYGTMYRLAHENGAIVMSEDVNPATPVDGLEYYKNTDWTGGEFWIRAGQNWKPNDMRDGISAARMYGKKVVFAEAFTGGGWQDHPFAMKAMGDHNYAEGLNRMMLHVWNEQHHPSRVPGIPGAGTPFNHLNTWWKAAQPWRDYMKRAQALLQSGMPVSDALYFTGENIPCRSLLPPKLGSCWVQDPAIPDGYLHESINRDALLRLAKVQNGQVAVSGIRYRLLVLRASEPYLTLQVARKIRDMIEAGATVVGPKPQFAPSAERGAEGQKLLREIADEVWGKIDGKTVTENRFGKGRVYWGKPMTEVLAAIGASPDVLFNKLLETATGKPVLVDASSPKGASPVQVGAARRGWGMEFTHRAGQGYDIYFLSNQEFFPVSTEVSFRITGRIPEFWYADTGKIVEAPQWREQGGRTVIPMDFDPAGSVFVVFWRPSAGSGKTLQVKAANVPAPIAIGGSWNVSFPVRGSAKSVDLQTGSWTDSADEDVKYFSGTATYKKQFTIPADRKSADKRLYLDLGDVQNLARVRLNGKDLGVLWKAPYAVDITAAAVAGTNRLELEVTNTWVNRMAGDAGKPQEQRVTWAGAGGRGGAPQLLPAGLIGPVRVVTEL